MGKKILILGASVLQLPAIEKARQMGLDTIVADMNPNALGFAVEGVVKEVVSTIDIPAILEIAKKHNIDGIMTLATDMPMRAVATVAKELGLVGISMDTAIKATNKAEMREALNKFGVPIPMFFRVSAKEQYNNAVRKIEDAGYKCIVKPADNSGSRGIVLLDNFNPETVDKAYDYARKYSRSGELMVEEYMEGPEVSVETLSIKGECHVIQITDKLTTGAPYFVEMGHSQPSRLSEEIKNKIKKLAIDANYAIGIMDGPSHTEIKVTKDGPKIVELGARLGGDNITTSLVPLSTGVDMVECCIKIALGEEFDIEQKWCKGSAVRYFEQDKGKILDISNVDAARKMDGIHDICVVHQVGEIVDGIKSSGDRIGFVIAQADTAEQAVNICENAKKMINIVME